MNPVDIQTKIIATVVMLAVLILAGAGLYIKGRSDGKALMEGRLDKERLEWIARVEAAQESADITIEKIVRDHNKQVAVYEEQIDKLNARKVGVKVVEKVVKVYVPQEVDTTIPKGFVDMHNTAADGLPLAEEAKPDAAQDSGKKLSDVAAVVARNYYTCNITREQLKSLQAVVREYEEKQKDLVK